MLIILQALGIFSWGFARNGKKRPLKSPDSIKTAFVGKFRNGNTRILADKLKGIAYPQALYIVGETDAWFYSCKHPRIYLSKNTLS